ncbi:hypothetical protein EOL94_00945 [bacterium]|nr:hypothetical protein [bacterium]
MNLYLYDDFLNKGKYQKTISKIETRITDLGLTGKIIRLNNLKNIDKIIQEEVKKGARTIIPVGNDKTFTKALKAITREELNYFFKDIILSFIPIEKSEIGLSLGIKNFSDACNLLLARRIEEIELARVNKLYFLTVSKIENSNKKITINSSYSIELLKNSSAYIVNIPNQKLYNKIANISQNNEKDLFLYIENKNSYSFFPFKKISISKEDGKSSEIIIDYGIKEKLPINISISNKKIKLIVGKNRLFNINQ